MGPTAAKNPPSPPPKAKRELSPWPTWGTLSHFGKLGIFATGGDAEAFLDRAERIDPATWQAGREQGADGQAPSDSGEGTKAKPKGNRKASRRADDDTRPVISLRNGEIAAAVDAAEDALIARGGLYQRGNQIVLMGEAPVKTHDNKEVTASRIFEVGEYALAEKIASAACVMKFDARVNDDVVTNPPAWLVKTLQQRTGHFRFQILTAIINAPTLRPDGSLLDAPGYDEATGLYYDPRGVEFPKIPESPTRRDAERALADLSELLGGFPFETEDGRAVTLSAILTACVRQGLPTAPMHGFSAPTAGSGKGKLVDVSSVVATGREAGVIPQCASEEELEKRIDCFGFCRRPAGFAEFSEAVTRGAAVLCEGFASWCAPAREGESQ